ncbi:MAG: recombinase family protein, partial [Candidatus Babeliales bacterium]
QITESSSRGKRKQFNQAIDIIKKAKEPYALITDTVDRLQRSFRETPLLDDLRRDGKVELHFLREGLVVSKNSNSSQMQQWNIGVVFASSYVLQLSDNVKRSKEQCTLNGQWTSKAPFGYKNVVVSSNKKIIEIDPQSAPFVVKIFELYATGNHSFQTIADEMNLLGMKSAAGKYIMRTKVENTLKNPFYYGVMKVKGELYKHNYPSLISEWLFNKVQDILLGHGKVHVQYAGKPILFRGLIKCAACGCSVVGYLKKGKYMYYSCSNAKGICRKVLVREEKLLAPLIKNFENIQLTNEQVEEIVGYLKQSFKHEQDFVKNTQEILHKELNLVQGRLSKLVDMHMDGQIDSETFQAKQKEYKQRQREILLQMQDHVDADESTIITAKIVLDLARRAKELFLSSNLDEKWQLLNLVHSNFLLDSGKLHCEMREPFSTFAKMQDCTEWCA